MLRGLLQKKGKQMSDKAQTRLLSILTLAIFEAVKRPLGSQLLPAEVPGKRSLREDAMDAAMQAAVRVPVVILASVLVRQLANQRR